MYLPDDMKERLVNAVVEVDKVSNWTAEEMALYIVRHELEEQADECKTMDELVTMIAIHRLDNPAQYGTPDE